MGSVSTPPGGSVFGVGFPVIWEVIGGDVSQPLLFGKFGPLEPKGQI
jgi:hypothetical protein